MKTSKRKTCPKNSHRRKRRDPRNKSPCVPNRFVVSKRNALVGYGADIVGEIIDLINLIQDTPGERHDAIIDAMVNKLDLMLKILESL